MAQHQNKHTDPSLLTLLEDAIDFAVYRVVVDPTAEYGARVVMVSPSITKIVGMEDPWRFANWFNNIHPDDLGDVLAANQRAITEGVRYDVSARCFNHDKSKWVWVRTISTPVFDSKGKLLHFTGVMLDITDQKNAESEINRRSAFEKLILALATRFINLPFSSIDTAICEALQEVGEFTSVDRSYLFSFDNHHATMTCTHEWCGEGIPAQISRLQNLEVAAFPWSNSILLGGNVLHIPSLEDMPEEAQAEKNEFQTQRILSLLAVPMFYQGHVVGFLGFDSVRERKSWPSDSLDILHIVSSIFVNALENKKAQQDLQQAKNDLEIRVQERTDELGKANQILQREVEQRRQAEESLKISQALYLEVFDNSPMQLFVQEVLPNDRFRVLRTNPAHQEASGLSPDQIWGKTVEELVIPEVAAAINQHYLDCVQARKVIEYEEEGPTPYWNLERIRTYRTKMAPVYDEHGKIVRLVGSSEDITEKKLAEKIILQRSRDEAIAEERSRLARELHDAVTQTLFSTTLLADVLPKIWAKNPQEGEQKLADLRDLTRGALAEMRTLLMELRPDALAAADLNELMRHLTNAFIARARIPIQVTVECDHSLPVDIKIAFYRVAQEALNNIAKHSEATRVSLSLVCSPQEVALSVADDGQGFDLQSTRSSDHYGLKIMQERADEICAIIEIESRIKQGTQIKMVWLAEPDQNSEKRAG